ncbi:hypothetical protein CROQUDRAFT_725766 [Cronartium quercuum f. sp. fusiforme G11]|uniref:Uncharacterized protein n=1 Tax=Cronartium quercuum f. sp. fusiforme G11 TaxID=708437 RepID=A0A9P6NCG7_9BASI|nr:hypothetical protein CROQUDRAFT_725766 [Cronartium quercuum f. sp. fusiforme G11]
MNMRLFSLILTVLVLFVGLSVQRLGTFYCSPSPQSNPIRQYAVCGSGTPSYDSSGKLGVSGYQARNGFYADRNWFTCDERKNTLGYCCVAVTGTDTPTSRTARTSQRAWNGRQWVTITLPGRWVLGSNGWVWQSDPDPTPNAATFPTFQGSDCSSVKLTYDDKL